MVESLLPIALGQAGPAAAQALEAVLTRLLRVALDFLARTFGLDKLPKLLRIGLNALRRPVDKGINCTMPSIALSKKLLSMMSGALTWPRRPPRGCFPRLKAWAGPHYAAWGATFDNA